MQVTFNDTRRMCEDGYSVQLYEKGKTYDMRELAARRAVQRGWAVESKHAEKNHG